MQQEPEGRARLRLRTTVEHAVARVQQRQGFKAGYKGTRKKTLDLRRVAVVTISNTSPGFPRPRDLVCSALLGAAQSRRRVRTPSLQRVVDAGPFRLFRSNKTAVRSHGIRDPLDAANAGGFELTAQRRTEPLAQIAELFVQLRPCTATFSR